MPREPAQGPCVAYYPFWYGNDSGSVTFANTLFQLIAIRRDVSIVQVDFATRQRFNFSFVENVYLPEDVERVDGSAREHLARLLKGDFVLLKTVDGFVTDVLIELPAPYPA